MAWPSGEVSSWTTPCRVTAVAPRQTGGLVAACEEGWAFIDLERETIDAFGDPEPEILGNRFNDGKVDRQGAFWAGTMDDAEEAETGALYRLDPSLRWTRVDGGYRITNGPAFSPDGAWLYHSDSARQRVYRFPLHGDGSVGARETFLQFGAGEGHPDGMTVDAQGCLWIAFWDGWCLRRFDPGGETIGRIDLPVQRPTSCTFGGPDLDALFITSARIGLSAEQLAEQPHAGDLFVARPAVGGLVQPPFAG
jgi:sugar lactone lactonase YvrE